MAPYPQDFPFGIMDVVELLHLNIRRRQADSVYTDCPFCGDRRGKMNVNIAKNVWRCNYCDEHGGMLALYARYHNTTNSDAYREICEALQTGDTSWGYGEGDKAGLYAGVPAKEPYTGGGMPQAEPASLQEVHQTLSLLFSMLTLSDAHRAHLRSDKRGLTDEQIDRMGFKSTPPYFLCRSLTERLIKQGCTVEGVPGFYLHDGGYWTARFSSRTAGILIPAIGIDGLVRGAQILLDTPFKNKDDPPEKTGTKYIWFSSSTKNKGVTSGSPVHFVGDPFARTVYVTEGLLKADIAHCLTGRSFVAAAGANNVQQLDPLFALLARNGTELIIEAHDMDKYSNEMTARGSSKVYLMARQHGMECRRLTWNPNYKGIDDWQLSIRRKKEQGEGEKNNFKERYLCGQCGIKSVQEQVQKWHSQAGGQTGLAGYLGLTEEEYAVFCRDGEEALGKILDSQRQGRHFRIYQLDFDAGRETLPFAFKGIRELYKAGYEQPPSSSYRLVCDSSFVCPIAWGDGDLLDRIMGYYGGSVPEGYGGHPLASSDVVELNDDTGRRYFYVDGRKFEPVRFSPFLAKPMKR
ncbi:MAG: YodL domain-containing protein [Lachnospiraceae bacterium]|nr:YodL domain-containing protein [Lachnospiraceae bacterium]MCM1239377.1 YodL domain-containing protein [Lachnospiraceae bacterium]